MLEVLDTADIVRDAMFRQLSGQGRSGMRESAMSRHLKKSAPLLFALPLLYATLVGQSATPATQVSVRGGKAHLFYDGAVPWIRMKKIETWIALQEHQVRRTLTITHFQITDGLFFTSEPRVRIGEITG